MSYAQEAIVETIVFSENPELAEAFAQLAEAAADAAEAMDHHEV